MCMRWRRIKGSASIFRWRREIGHAEVCDSVSGGQQAHGLQLAVGGGEAGLDRGDLAEPSVVPGFVHPVEQVGGVTDITSGDPL
jgi:hypothetical protein